MEKNRKEKPLYMQIYTELKERIESGEWSYGAMLPSEHELCDVYGVSRGTVRQVLGKLEEDGFIRRERGKGTFIARRGVKAQNDFVSQSISFIVPYVRDSFVSSILLGLENVARSSGYTVVFHHVENDIGQQATALRRAVQQRVAGIVLYPVNSKDASPTLSNLVRERFPLVIVDRYIRGVFSNYVVSDNFGGGVIATQHLLSMEHRRIAFLSWAEISTSMEHRRLGYRHALLEAGIEPDSNLEWEVIGYPEIDHNAIVEYFLQPGRPTAIFAANDQLALTVQNVAQSLNLQIPDDLALVGFDDLDISTHLDIPLTTVAQPAFDMGSTAGDLVICQISEKDDCTHRHILPVQLIIRRSCGAAIPTKRKKEVKRRKEDK
jgi:DNA-binding LacI/PurR family transcriptional regulator